MIVFGYMIDDTRSDKKLKQIINELFIRGRKLNIYLVLMTQSYFAIPNNNRPVLNTIFLWNFQINNNFSLSHSLDIDYEFSENKCTAELYSALINEQIILYVSKKSFRKYTKTNTTIHYQLEKLINRNLLQMEKY